MPRSRIWGKQNRTPFGKKNIHQTSVKDCLLHITKFRIEFRQSLNFTKNKKINDPKVLRVQTSSIIAKMLLKEIARFSLQHRTLYCYLILSIWIFLLIAGKRETCAGVVE